MRPFPGEPGTKFHVHSPVVGRGPSPLPHSRCELAGNRVQQLDARAGAQLGLLVTAATPWASLEGPGLCPADDVKAGR